MDDPKQQGKVERFLEKEHAATPVKTEQSVLKEGRRTNNYLYSGTGADALAQALDPKWPGPLPYTVVIAPGGEVLARFSGEVDVTAFQDRLIDILGGFHKPPPAL